MQFLNSEYITAITFFIILLGLATGSFLNVCIYRIPRGESVVFPPSHCPSCMTNIKWYDNIPVISYILLKGKCRQCGEKISIRYPIIELLNCVLWLLTFVFAEDLVQCLFGLAFSSMLIVVAAVDLDRMEILDFFSVSILILAVLKAGTMILFGNPVKDVLIDFGVGALSGSVLLTLLYFLILKLTKKEGLGGGDVKFTFACGAFLGWKAVLFGIGLSAYIGLIVLILLAVIRKRSLKEAFPYGPFLAAGYFIAFLFFKDIFTWYINFIH